MLSVLLLSLISIPIFFRLPAHRYAYHQRQPQRYVLSPTNAPPGNAGALLHQQPVHTSENRLLTEPETIALGTLFNDSFQTVGQGRAAISSLPDLHKQIVKLRLFIEACQIHTILGAAELYEFVGNVLAINETNVRTLFMLPGRAVYDHKQLSPRITEMLIAVNSSLNVELFPFFFFNEKLKKSLIINEPFFDYLLLYLNDFYPELVRETLIHAAQVDYRVPGVDLALETHPHSKKYSKEHLNVALDAILKWPSEKLSFLARRKAPYDRQIVRAVFGTLEPTERPLLYYDYRVWLKILILRNSQGIIIRDAALYVLVEAFPTQKMEFERTYEKLVTLEWKYLLRLTRVAYKNKNNSTPVIILFKIVTNDGSVVTSTEEHFFEWRFFSIVRHYLFSLALIRS